MFWRRRNETEDLPVVSNEGYKRWLRAHRPPFNWFFGLGEDQQEALANLGDAHVLEMGEFATQGLQETDSLNPVEDAKKAMDRMMQSFAEGKRKAQVMQPDEDPLEGSSLPPEVVAGLRAEGASPATFAGIGNTTEIKNGSEGRGPRHGSLLGKKAESE